MAAAILLAVATGACGGGDDKPVTPELVAREFSFEPTELRARPGQQVTLTFTNDGEVPHNLSIPSIPVDLDFEPGTSETIIFVPPSTPGPLEFFCKFHQDRGMKGTIQVQL